MQELFNGLDSSGDGKVNLKEFRMLAKFPQVKSWLASMEIRAEDLDIMFQLMDGDGSGHITFEEMLDGMERLKGHARSVDLFALMRAQQQQMLKEVGSSDISGEKRKKRASTRPAATQQLFEKDAGDSPKKVEH